mmetsp:Transcript_13302/g.36539  ORF Transcript_13302/g.36539 Transcript_13302/m.36539 type:complete len:228 (+) Transcript_13302:286-969(+)
MKRACRALPNSAWRVSPARSPARRPSRSRWNCGRQNPSWSSDCSSKASSRLRASRSTPLTTRSMSKCFLLTHCSWSCASKASVASPSSSRPVTLPRRPARSSSPVSESEGKSSRTATKAPSRSSSARPRRWKFVWKTHCGWRWAARETSAKPSWGSSTCSTLPRCPLASSTSSPSALSDMNSSLTTTRTSFWIAFRWSCFLAFSAKTSLALRTNVGSLFRAGRGGGL